MYKFFSDWLHDVCMCWNPGTHNISLLGPWARPLSLFLSAQLSYGIKHNSQMNKFITKLPIHDNFKWPESSELLGAWQPNCQYNKSKCFCYVQVCPFLLILCMPDIAFKYSSNQKKEY